MTWGPGSTDPLAGEHPVLLWEAAGLTVLARWGDGGALVIEGQDLNYPDLEAQDGSTLEYEYAVVIPPGEIPKVLRGLDAPLEADVLAVLEQRGAELIRVGESRWLERLGIRADFSAHFA